MKKVLCFILAVLTVFSLTACQKQAPSDSNSDRYIITESEYILDSGTVISESTASGADIGGESSNTPTADSSYASSSGEAPSSSAGGKSETAVYNVDWDSIGRFELPDTALKAALAQEYTKPKSVILMIGDGMGLIDLIHAEKYGKNLFHCGVVINDLPNSGFCITHNIKGTTTDSAAAATALATGVKIVNGTLGLDSEGNKLTNACETARKASKKVGIITSDAVVGATPSGFMVHTDSRNNTSDIVNGILDFAPDFLVGDGYSSFSSIFKANTDPRVQGIAYTYSYNNFHNVLKANPDKPFFGFIDFDLGTDYYSLANCVDLALDRLENPNGFFLMVESAGPDKGGHNNNVSYKQTGVISLDKAVAVALKYCAQHPDTVLIVTSDHETGGVMQCNGDTLTADIFTTTGHTNSYVGVFSIGYGTEIFRQNTVDNTDIAKFVLSILKGQ